VAAARHLRGDARAQRLTLEDLRRRHAARSQPLQRDLGNLHDRLLGRCAGRRAVTRVLHGKGAQLLRSKALKEGPQVGELLGIAVEVHEHGRARRTLEKECGRRARGRLEHQIWAPGIPGSRAAAA
jgi:hypothetical protein